MVKPFVLKNAPALIEKIWPAQKISAESYKDKWPSAVKP